MSFNLPKGKPEFTKSTKVGLIIFFASSFFLSGCSNPTSPKPLSINSCTELSVSMRYFQQNCRIDSDCMRVSDPSSFCYSEAVHVSKKDEYETFFKQLNCPLDKADQNDRGDYCKVDWKSENYCNQSTGICTPGKKS